MIDVSVSDIDHALDPSKSPHYKNTLSGALVER